MKLNSAAQMTDPPGTVLRDVHTLLDMLRTDGIEAGSGGLPALKALPLINARLAEPLQVNLQRAQFRSYPNIQAVYLLLRTTGLLQLESVGAKRKLVVDPANAEAFCSLNPTEQFGSLLDAWLTKAQFPAISIDRSWLDNFPRAAGHCWKRIGASGRKFTSKEREGSDAAFAYDLDRVSLWLLRGFGMIDLKQGVPIAGKPWHPAAVGRLPFGQATLAVLAQARSLPYDLKFAFHEFRGDSGQEDIEEDDDDEDYDSELAPAGLRDGVSFSTLRQALQSHWPAWQRSLELPPLAFRDGTFTFKVSLGTIWRRIAIPARKSFDHLAAAIIDSVRFDNDHLWEFQFLNRFGTKVSIVHPYMDDAPESHRGNEVLIGDIPLAGGESMLFRYDIGDNWQFDATLERVDGEGRKLKGPKVVESHGKAPRQYTDWI